MKRGNLSLFHILLLACSILLSSCTVFSPGESGATPTPRARGTRVFATPTPEMAGFKVVEEAQYCLRKQLKSVKTGYPQANLAAWSPDGQAIAWIQPTEAHLWYAGDLYIARAPDYSSPVLIAQNVAGSITWSPDGERLAFSTLRPSEGIYTVYVVNADGTAPQDLFPDSAARLDSYASPKVILSWPSPSRLQIMAECGPGCLRYLGVDPSTGFQTDLTTASQVNPTAAWLPQRNTSSYDEPQFPQMIEPNWSEDKSTVVYFDEKGYLWALLVPEKTAFRIHMETVLPVFLSQDGNRETHWSSDGKLAVRVDDQLIILQMRCTP